MGNKPGYTGQFLTVHMYVHGYKRNEKNNSIQDELHHIYTSPNMGPQSIMEYFKEGVSHVHYVLNYKCNALDNDVAKMIENVNSQKDLFKNPYEGIHDLFEGHVTIAVLKKCIGKVTEKSKRFGSNEYKYFVNLYQKIISGYSKNKKVNMQLNSFRIDGAKIGKNIRTTYRTLIHELDCESATEEFFSLKQINNTSDRDHNINTVEKIENIEVTDNNFLNNIIFIEKEADQLKQ